MDPLTIVASASTTCRLAATISTALFGFIQTTKQVDGTVNALHREVQNLGQTVTAMENVLRQSATQAIIGRGQDFHLARAVDESLVECRDTMERLDRRLEVVRGDRPGRGLLGQMIRAVRLNLNADEIRLFRGQMHAHCLAMQLALQTINVYHSIYSIMSSRAF
jgi:hypothetical protein